MTTDKLILLAGLVLVGVVLAGLVIGADRAKRRDAAYARERAAEGADLSARLDEQLRQYRAR